MKKIPLRKCCVSGEELPKKHMLRIVRNKEGEVFLDLVGRANGRGAYIRAKKEVLEQAIATKQLQKSLNVKEIDESLFEKLKEYCK